MPRRSRQYKQAAKQRAACMAQIREWNREDGGKSVLDMTDDELLEELGLSGMTYDGVLAALGVTET